MALIVNQRLFSIFFSILLLFIVFYNYFSIINSIINCLGSVLITSKLSYDLLQTLRIFAAKHKTSSKCRSTGAILITGCDSGFGNRLAYRLNEMGFRVYATVLDPCSEGSIYLLKNCKYSQKLNVLGMNVTEREDINTVYNYVENDLISNSESLIALVNNAGITHLGHVDWGLMDAYKNILNVNTFGTVAMTLRFLPLIKHSMGRIINMSSVNGRMTFPKTGHYCMSKHAITAFSDALRRHVNPRSVGVSTIEPAFYRTPLLDNNAYKRVMDREWEQTSSAVKELYGQKYFDSMEKIGQNVDQFVGNNIDEVVDNIIDAIVSPVQQIRYLTISGFIIKSLIYVGERAPIEWFDTTWYALEKLIRYEKIAKI